MSHILGFLKNLAVHQTHSIICQGHLKCIFVCCSQALWATNKNALK
jgi:hypothetical protein